jgi:hypothetical protein
MRDAQYAQPDHATQARWMLAVLAILRTICPVLRPKRSGPVSRCPAAGREADPDGTRERTQGLPWVLSSNPRRARP